MAMVELVLSAHIGAWHALHSESQRGYFVPNSDR